MWDLLLYQNTTTWGVTKQEMSSMILCNDWFVFCMFTFYYYLYVLYSLSPVVRLRPFSLVWYLEVKQRRHLLVDDLVGEVGVGHGHVHGVPAYLGLDQGTLSLQSCLIIFALFVFIWIFALEVFLLTWNRDNPFLNELAHLGRLDGRGEGLDPLELLLLGLDLVLLPLLPQLLLHLPGLGEHLVDVHDLVESFVTDHHK